MRRSRDSAEPPPGPNPSANAIGLLAAAGEALPGENLRIVRIPGANLQGMILCGADLSGADLSGADVQGAILDGARRAGARLAGLDTGALERTLRVLPAPWLGGGPVAVQGEIIGVDPAAMAMSADGAWLAVALASRQVQVWNVLEEEGGPRVRHLLPPEQGGGGIRALCMTPDAGTLAYASDTAVCLWDWDRRSPGEPWNSAGQLSHPEEVVDCSLSADGRTVASCAGPAVYVWTLTGVLLPKGTKQAQAEAWTEPRVCLGHAGPVRCVSIFGNGTQTRVVSGGEDCSVRVWCVATGTQTLGPPLVHRAAVSCVAAVGGVIVSGGGQCEDDYKREDTTVRVWDADTGAERRVLRHAARISTVQVGDDFILAGCFNGMTWLWSIESGQCLQHFYDPRSDRRYRTCYAGLLPPPDSARAPRPADASRVVRGDPCGVVQFWSLSPPPEFAPFPRPHRV